MHGKVQFKHVSARYRPEYENAISSLSFKVQSGMRVGIVCRADHGQDTLVQTMQRLLPYDEG